ncbi:MAG TPA: hypothetical protein VJL29_10860 [Thermoguttaceae bacterium]|nr:hypothetical protein [Thermoguttaceae bacterium]
MGSYSNVIELVLLLTVLTVLVVAAGKVLAKIRPKPIQQEPTVAEMLSKCREMHSRGELSDAEFRTIKATLAERLQNELRDDGQKGCDA